MIRNIVCLREEDEMDAIFKAARLFGRDLFRANSRVADNIVRVGVNYRFGGAVLAKY
jgi:hypothetical protein